MANYETIGLRAVIEGAEQYISQLKQMEAGQRSLGTSAQTAAPHADSLNSSLKNIVQTAMGFSLGSAFMNLPNLLKGFAQGAMEDEAGAMRLTKALENVTAQGGNAGKSMAQLQAEMEKQIAIGQSLAFSDDQIREAMTRLLGSTNSTEEAQKRLRVAMDMSRGTGMELATVARLAGKITDESVTAFQRYGVVLEEGATSAEAFQAIEKKFGGQAATYAKTTAGQFAIAKIQMDELGESIGYSLLPAFTSIATVAIPVLDGLTVVIDGLSASVNDNLTVVIGAATVAFEALEPAITPVVELLSDFWEFLNSFGPTKVAIEALTFALGLAAGAAGVYVGWMTLGAALHTASAIGAAAHAVGIGLVTAATWAWTAAQIALDVAMAPLTLTIGAVVLAVAALAAGAYLLYTNWDTVSSAITDSGAWDVASTAVSGLADAFGAVMDALSAANDALDDAGIKWTVLGALFGPIGLAVGLIIDNWGALTDAFWASIDAIEAVSSALYDAGSAVLDFVGTVIDDGARVIEWFGDLPDHIKNGLQSLGSELKQLAIDAMQGFIDGLKSKAGDVASAIDDALGGIPSKVIGIFDSHSPSRVMEEIGYSIPEGLAAGINSGIGTAVAAVDAMGNAVLSEAAGIVSEFNQILSGLFRANITLTGGFSPAPGYTGLSGGFSLPSEQPTPGVYGTGDDVYRLPTFGEMTQEQQKAALERAKAADQAAREGLNIGPDWIFAGGRWMSPQEALATGAGITGITFSQYSSSATRGGGGGGGGAREAAKTAAEEFTSAFEDAMRAANLEDAFGELGAKFMDQFSDAMTTPSAARSLPELINQLIEQAKEEGVPNAEELGQALSQAVADGLTIGGGGAAVEEALGNLTSSITEHAKLTVDNLNRELGKIAESDAMGSAGSRLMESLEKAIREGGSKNNAALAEAVSGLMDQLDSKMPEGQAAYLGTSMMTALQNAITAGTPESLESLRGWMKKINEVLEGGALDIRNGTIVGADSVKAIAEAFKVSAPTIIENIGLIVDSGLIKWAGALDKMPAETKAAVQAILGELESGKITVQRALLELAGLMGIEVEQIGDSIVPKAKKVGKDTGEAIAKGLKEGGEEVKTSAQIITQKFLDLLTYNLKNEIEMKGPEVTQLVNELKSFITASDLPQSAKDVALGTIQALADGFTQNGSLALESLIAVLTALLEAANAGAEAVNKVVRSVGQTTSTGFPVPGTGAPPEDNWRWDGPTLYHNGVPVSDPNILYVPNAAEAARQAPNATYMYTDESGVVRTITRKIVIVPGNQGSGGGGGPATPSPTQTTGPSGIQIQSFQHGSAYVPFTQQAVIHKGEMVIPASLAALIRSGQAGRSVTVDMRGAQLTGTLAQNEAMMRRVVRDALADESGPSAFLWGR